jgi:hypothetical protein
LVFGQFAFTSRSRFQELQPPERPDPLNSRLGRHRPKRPGFASSSLLALFGQKRKASKTNYLEPSNDATLATNAD